MPQARDRSTRPAPWQSMAYTRMPMPEASPSCCSPGAPPPGSSDRHRRRPNMPRTGNPAKRILHPNSLISSVIRLRSGSNPAAIEIGTEPWAIRSVDAFYESVQSWSDPATWPRSERCSSGRRRVRDDDGVAGWEAARAIDRENGCKIPGRTAVLQSGSSKVEAGQTTDGVMLSPRPGNRRVRHCRQNRRALCR